MKTRYVIWAVALGLILMLTIILVKLNVTSNSREVTANTDIRPYLSGVTHDSVWVLVESTSSSPITVEYGTTKSYGSTATTTNTQVSPDASPKIYVHNIKLANLEPETRYYYRVQQESDISEGFSFKSAAKPGTPFRFAFLADSRSGHTVFSSIASKIRTFGPDFILFGGDLTNTSEYSCFKEEWFIDENLKLLAESPIYFSPGNHEGWGDNSKAFFQGPANYDANDPDYYSFDYGDLHVTMVNAELDYSKGSPQYNWVKNDIASSSKPWKVVFSHKPVYSAGGYDADSDLTAMSNDIFEPNGVSMVLAGHSHFYQHNLVNGIHHMIVGSAGVETTTPGKASFTVKSKQTSCFVIIDVSQKVLSYTAYDYNGSVIENINLTAP